MLDMTKNVRGAVPLLGIGTPREWNPSMSEEPFVLRESRLAHISDPIAINIEEEDR